MGEQSQLVWAWEAHIQRLAQSWCKSLPFLCSAFQHKLESALSISLSVRLYASTRKEVGEKHIGCPGKAHNCALFQEFSQLIKTLILSTEVKQFCVMLFWHMHLYSEQVILWYCNEYSRLATRTRD